MARAARWLGVAALLALVVTACESVPRVLVDPPDIEGATFVGNATCADCHTNIYRAFPSSPHARGYRAPPNTWPMGGCESCHGPGSRHVASGGGLGLWIVNPGQDPAACLRCHVEVEAAFRLPHHHPVPESRMNCVDCHDPHGFDIMKPVGGLAMARLNESCGECHQEMTRPFVFEHEALREGCVVCHTPHGSVNRKLLLDRDPNLCLTCHAQMQPVPGRIVIGKEDHTDHLRLGTCYSAGCHTAVHGSNVNPKLRY